MPTPLSNCRRSALCLAVVVSTFLSSGCASHPVDLVATGVVKTDQDDSNLVDLSPPRVYRDDDIMEVTGTVTRKSGVEGPIPEGVRIDFLTPAGGAIERLYLTWIPSEIPVNGSRQSTYDINYSWLPPTGTTVRVAYPPAAQDAISGGSGGGPK